MKIKTENRIIYFLKELLDPEGFGYAVTFEVREEAKQLLIMIESDINEQDSAIRQTV
jgi:hypothetical protein